MPRILVLPPPNEASSLKDIRINEALARTIRQQCPNLPVAALGKYLTAARYLLAHYLRRREQGLAPTAEQHEILLQKVIDTGTEFHESLARLPGVSEFYLLAGSGRLNGPRFDDNCNRMTETCTGIVWIVQRAKQAIPYARKIETGARRAIREDRNGHVARNPEIAHLVDELVRIYKPIFGKAATSFMHAKGGDYASRSVSEAGTLITLLIASVDKSVSPQTIAACLSRAVRRQKSQTGDKRAAPGKARSTGIEAGKNSGPAEG